MSRSRRVRGTHRPYYSCGVWTGQCWTHVNPAHVVYLIAIYFIHALVACPEFCTCPDMSNQVTCMGAELTDVPRTLPPSLTTLDLTKNKIHTLSETSLASLRSVVNLKLKENEIDTIHSGAFQSVASLQTLDLSMNKLTELTEFTFQGASGLLHLDLSSNQLETINGALAGMTELSRLDLHDNLLTEITQDMLADQKNLRYLLLAENRISVIDKKAFKNLEKLTYLVLKGNPISQVLRFKFYSYFLSYVDLSECGLTHVPRGLPNSIRYLQLRRNNITEIGRHTFQDCPFISILVLDENGITEINEQTFEHMTYLQQLWLNNNNLRRVPPRLPTSLQRLLVDQNNIEYVNDVFPPGSQLTTLSLMGNNITYLSYSALHKVPNLQSADFSNNQISHIYGNTFLNSSRLETLQLSKNPLQYFHSHSFHGLATLQTLSLAYIPTVISMHQDSFRDVLMLTKLDLDSSHWIILTILSEPVLLSALESVEDLSVQSSDLTTLSEEFLDFFPKLETLHISSTRWHCDKSMIWFRNWLLVTEIRIENKDDLTCFSPHDLNGRSITSLSDHEFAPTTTLKFSTMLPTPPGKLTTFPSVPPSSPTNKASVRPTTQAPSSVQDQTTEGGTSADYEEYYYKYDDSDEDVVNADKPLEPFDLDSLYHEVYGDPPDDGSKHSSRYPTWGGILRSTESPGATNKDGSKGTKYDPNGVQDGNLQIRPVSESELDGPTQYPASAREGTDTGPKTSTVVIIIATSIATVIVAAVLIFVIVYLSRKGRDKKKPGSKNKAKHSRHKKKKRENFQNGIKYKSRNDVLYFMPKNQDGSTSESLQTQNSKEGMTLIPGRDINHEGPLRVYKWEDF